MLTYALDETDAKRVILALEYVAEGTPYQGDRRLADQLRRDFGLDDGPITHPEEA